MIALFTILTKLTVIPTVAFAPSVTLLTKVTFVSTFVIVIFVTAGNLIINCVTVFLLTMLNLQILLNLAKTLFLPWLPRLQNIPFLPWLRKKARSVSLLQIFPILFNTVSIQISTCSLSVVE